MIRLATLEDVPAIKQIANQYPSELGYVMPPALRESVARSNLLVLVLNEQVVGFVNYRACRDGWQTIYEIAVHKTRRAQGLGAVLLKHVPLPVRLKCTQDNTANAFYHKQGFNLVRVETGRKRPLNVWHKISIGEN